MSSTFFQQSGSGSGSGGGSSLIWIEGASAATPIFENNMRVYEFGAALSQSLYASVRVPSTYLAGQQINLRITFYSPDSSGNALVQSVATLIRTGTDAASSTTNQRTSTNAAVSLGAGTVNKPQSVVLDLTSTAGQINSVNVSAGDLILIQLTRGTDTATSDLKLPVTAAEVTFSV